jgi:hypothetical protein
MDIISRRKPAEKFFFDVISVMDEIIIEEIDPTTQKTLKGWHYYSPKANMI